MKKVNKNTQKVAVLGLFSALICIVSFLPIRTLGLEITLSMVPVALGACLYGPSAGAVLGGVFGTISFLQCFGYSPFGAALLGMNLFYTLMVCIPTRILAGWLAGLAASGVRKLCKSDFVSMATGSVLAPVFNTLFFMSALCLFFYNTEFIQGFANTLGSGNVFAFILLFVGINGLVEIIAGFVVALPLAKALSKAL
jgi:uncharacterized membrane protein